MRSDSVKNMSASLTRITRQVSRTFDLNLRSSGLTTVLCLHLFQVYQRKQAKTSLSDLLHTWAIQRKFQPPPFKYDICDDACCHDYQIDADKLPMAAI